MPKGLLRSLSRSTKNLEVKSVLLGSPALGDVDIIMAAFTDDGKYHRFYNLAAIWDSGGVAKRITATSGGTAADIKAVQVIVTGTDADDEALVESLPVFTVNAPTTVTSVGSFKTITEIEIPVMDGTGATVSLGVSGGGISDVIPAWTDKAANTVHLADATITNPDVPRNITASSDGTAGDIAAIQVIVHGKNRAGGAVSETLPVFTADSETTVVGLKAFALVEKVDVPVHSGTGATTSIGTGAKLGLPDKLSRDTILHAFLNGVREGTRPTVVISASAQESNHVLLSTALDGTSVRVDYYKA